MKFLEFLLVAPWSDYIQGVPKKQSRRFKGHFRPLNGRKFKKVRKGTPPKRDLLDGVDDTLYIVYSIYI